ncbi:MAG: UDP-N-acetylglucosamine 1-carboxyvinyltransferase [Oscillospiraceae bacterium]|jgi:UDP-N-acetylglucosamine 1-carboxyvinyltransferase|nr:UDP-N-acetylglucosamine 1-carboxyvinyltransferase [Oscillospiraceae bacterium]
MRKIVIEGGNKLYGSIKIQGAKNSVLPLLSASILNEGISVFQNVPNISDVAAAMKILRHLGCAAELKCGALTVDAREITTTEIPDGLMREMRSSVIFLGAILARCGEVTLSYPGGCELGPRPIDMHIKALRDLGADIHENAGKIRCLIPAGQRLTGRRIDFRGPSVGATENAMIASVLAQGTTIISNAAKEPEIWDLQMYLRKLGADIEGAGTSVITVRGIDACAMNVTHTIIPDRIVTGTYLCACAAAGGEILLTDCGPTHIESLISVLRGWGCEINTSKTSIHIKTAGARTASGSVVAEPYPAFPTDAAPTLVAAASAVSGNFVFVEKIFSERFKYCRELEKLGAEITLFENSAMVSGGRELTGAKAAATDLRGGAALAVAGLCAKGITEISEIQHIERGYEDLVRDLKSVGANIMYINTPEAAVSADAKKRTDKPDGTGGGIGRIYA